MVNNKSKLNISPIKDITDRKDADKRKSILAAIVNSSDDAIIGKDLDGTITSWNIGAEKIFGYPSEEAIGKNIRLIIPDELQDEEDMIIDKIKKGKSIKHFETVRVAKRGTKIDISLTISPIKNDKGRIIGASKVARDITQQKESVRIIQESERRYHELIHSSPSLIATFIGENHTVGIANSAILKAWGKDKKVIGKPFLEALPELKEQGFEQILKDVYETGKPYHAFEMPVDIKRNGKMERSYYNFIYYPQRDINNNIIGIVDIATEVTPQAEFNRKLRESESHFRQMADLMPGKVLNTDENGNAYYFNRHWLEDTGKSHEELEGRGWQQCIHPDDLESFINIWKKSLKTGKDFEKNFRCRNKNGTYQWYLGNAVPMENEDREIKIWINSAIEIQKLKEEEKRKEDFLKMVSHELKTPLTSIKGYTQMLLNLCNPANRSQLEKFPLESALERIDVQVSRLTRLISEVLDLSRLEDQTLKFKREPFDLNKLVKHTVEDIERTNTHYKIDVVDMEECTVFGDEERISQVVINFITNAIKYSPKNKNVEVKIHKAENDQLAVSVRDHGIGIDKKDQKKIFQRFYRVDGENQETYAGFGIGLFLCNQIIQRHKGAIHVESKKGKGSVFTFTLPCGE